MSARPAQSDPERFVQRLTDAGLPREAAEIVAQEHAGLMTAIPSDVATRSDLDVREALLRSDLDAREERLGADRDLREERLRSDLDLREERLRSELDLREERLRSEFRLQIELLRSELHVQGESLRKEMHQIKAETIKWLVTTMVIFSGIVIAAVGVLG